MSGTLADLLRGIIRDEGPIGLDRYMALALGHPHLGYYMTRDPLGASGDFTTAPEISQMFGELIGLWCAALYASLGAPARIVLVELGPGRGTLMADVLRAAKAVPDFRAAIDLHLVETSPVLRARQAQTLGPTGLVPRWHADVETLPDGPILVVANEFFDALPVRHFIRAERGWHERLVGLDGAGGLAFGLSGAPVPDLAVAAPPGAVLELCLPARTIMGALAGRVARFGGAVLALDYGYATPRFGESLQAIRAHAATDPLAAPGESDLTTHVDFAALVAAATVAGGCTHGPVAQGAFLNALGLAIRARALTRAKPNQARAIAAARKRLAGPAPGMGELFKALAVTAPGTPVPPGFDVPAPVLPTSRPSARDRIGLARTDP